MGGHDTSMPVERRRCARASLNPIFQGERRINRCGGGRGRRGGTRGGPGACAGARRLGSTTCGWLGSHNSYHLRPDRPMLPNEPADYAHAPLRVQLQEQGVRSLEFDAYNAPGVPGVPLARHRHRLDAATTSPCASPASTAWSKRHPKHQPLVVYVDAKAIPVSTNPIVAEVLGNATRDHGITRLGRRRLRATRPARPPIVRQVADHARRRARQAKHAARRRRARRLAHRGEEPRQGARDARRRAG